MTAPATTNKAIASIATLKSGEGIFSTIAGTDMASKKAILNALTNSVAVGDTLGTVINLSNIVVQAVTVNDAATGEPVDAVRVVLIDADGTSYSCVSDGIMNSLRDVFAIMGEPSTWTEPLPVVVAEKQGAVKGRKYYTLNIA